ncbi:MAG: formate dehydrogenase accessory protein FdhE, partial [Pseudomonadota bacterium]
LYKGILEILEPLEKVSNLGLKKTIDWGVISETAKRSLKERRHLSTYLDSSIFDAELVKETVLKLMDYLMAENPSTMQLNKVLEAIIEGSLVINDGIGALLGEDASWFHEKAQTYGVEPSLFLSVFELPLRPFFEEAARKLEKIYVEDWWEQTCPICGRNPPVGRMRSKKLYLVCQYCGTVYAVDLFQCFSCGSKDPTKLEFVSPESRPDLELNYCGLCKSYIKIINDDRLHVKVPFGLEDLLTRALDELAKVPELNLSRS